MRFLKPILLFLINTKICIGQAVSNEQRIADFKNDLMEKTERYYSDTLRLDSLTLVREKHPTARLVKTFQKNSNVVLYEYYQKGTTLLESSRNFDSLDRLVGIAKQYTDKGDLEYIVDYDNGTWVVYDKKRHRFYSLQNKMKIKADSLISKMYGYSFLINNVVWDVTGSYMTNAEGTERWTEEEFKKTPTKFLFRYNVKLDKDNWYERLIEVELDRKGNFIPDGQEAVFGFEDVPDSLKKGFKLTCHDAITKAKSLGLAENDSTKAVGVLYWEGFKKPAIYNGRFRFYVMIQTETIEKINPNGRSSRTIKYDAYSFNPWTGDFVEKKKMKSVSSWERMSRSSAGLIPDNE